MLGKRALNPGAKTELKAVFETAGRPGPFRKIVTLSTNIPGREDIEALIMMGTVKEAPSAKIQVDPRRIVLEGIEPGAVRNQNFSVKNNGNIPLVITRIYAQKSNVVYFDGIRAGNIIIEPESTRMITLEFKAGGVDEQEEMLIINCNARNASKGNYLIMISSH